MADQPQNQMTVDEAAQIHQFGVYVPHFFEKLARDYNFAVDSEEDALRAINMAAHLRNRYEETLQVKAASDSSFLAAAEEHLNASLGLPPASSVKQAAELRNAAAAAAADPQIRQAAMTLLAHSTQN